MAYENIPREQVTSTFLILERVLQTLHWGVTALPDPGAVHAVLDTVEEMASQVNETNRRLDTMFRAVARALDEIRIAEAQLGDIVDVAEAILREGADPDGGLRKRKIDDPDLRARLLDLIRAGHGRHEAALVMGISRASMRNWYRDDPEFRAEVEDAIDASIEPVLYKLRELAKDGDVTAANTYLKHMAPTPRAERDKRSTVEHQVKVSLNEISRIEELQAMLSERSQQRAAALPVGEEDWIEGEVLD